MSAEEKVAVDDISSRKTKEGFLVAREDNVPVDTPHEALEAEGDVFWEGDEDTHAGVEEGNAFFAEDYIDGSEEGDQEGAEVTYSDEVAVANSEPAMEKVEIAHGESTEVDAEAILQVVPVESESGGNAKEIETMIASQPLLSIGHKRRYEEKSDDPVDNVSRRRSTEHERTRDDDCRNRQKINPETSQNDRRTSWGGLNEIDRDLRSKEGLLEESRSLRYVSQREDEDNRGERHALSTQNLRREDAQRRPDERGRSEGRRVTRNSQSRQMRDQSLEQEGGHQPFSSRERLPSADYRRSRSRDHSDTDPTVAAGLICQNRNSQECGSTEIKRPPRDRLEGVNRCRSPHEARTRGRPLSQFSAVSSGSSSTASSIAASTSPERTCAVGVGPVTDDKSALSLFKALLTSNSNKDIQCRSAAVSWIEALRIYLHATDHPSDSGESAVQQALPTATTAISLLKTITAKACSPDAVARAEASVMAATFLFQSPLRNPQPLPSSFLAAWYDSNFMATSNSSSSESRSGCRSQSPEPKARSHWTAIVTKSGRVRESVRCEELESVPRHQTLLKQRRSETPSHLSTNKMVPSQDELSLHKLTNPNTPPSGLSKPRTTDERCSETVELSNAESAGNAPGGRAVSVPSAGGRA